MNLDGRLRRLRTDRHPDPLFRRRLRSEVLNRYVATREGLAPVQERRGREMGRLGRACLYASFALGVGCASFLAVSQEAVPGEPLYALKLRIEELRVDVLPRHLHDELAINVLVERVDEARRLGAAGSPESALRMAPAIERAYSDVQSRFASAGPADAAVLERRLAVAVRLVESLPAGLRDVLASLMPGLGMAVDSRAVDTPQAGGGPSTQP